jgi:adenylate cyclase
MLEIERKFLVVGNAWRPATVGSSHIRQGYLTTCTSPSIRIRTKNSDAWITVKFGTDPLNRLEFEYPIPLEDAEKMLSDYCTRPHIEKVRHYVPAGEDLIWEVDEFVGDLKGLLLAEIELPNANTPVPAADWLGLEVTNDATYLNMNLRRADLSFVNE